MFHDGLYMMMNDAQVNDHIIHKRQMFIIRSQAENMLGISGKYILKVRVEFGTANFARHYEETIAISETIEVLLIYVNQLRAKEIYRMFDL